MKPRKDKHKSRSGFFSVIVLFVLLITSNLSSGLFLISLCHIVYMTLVADYPYF